jgi:D-sedoheptulose 7-phosphate isomerase
MNSPLDMLEDLIVRYPSLKECKEDISKAYDILINCYENQNKVLIAGNGGSAADAEHIVGELMKGFLKSRELPTKIKDLLIKEDAQLGRIMGEKLQGALPTIALTVQSSLLTAFSNDVHPDLIFAQQVLGYGQCGDVFLGLSTSGDSQNIVYAACLARVIGMKTIGLTSRSGGKMRKFCDVIIRVPADSTPHVQELHLPVYHTLCAMVEEYFYN